VRFETYDQLRLAAVVDVAIARSTEDNSSLEMLEALAKHIRC
jgi:hypothetical protein